MSGRSSEKNDFKFIFKQPTSNLRRGKACLCCRYAFLSSALKYNPTHPTHRHHKTVRTRRDYRFRIRSLRFFFWQKCDGIKPICGPCIRTSREVECTYSDTTSRTKVLERNITRLQARLCELEKISSGSSSSSDVDPVDLSEQSLSLQPFSWPETSPPLSNSLDTFLEYSNQFGFFLHPERFRASALLPLGNPSRPSTALLAAVCLWGAHLSSFQLSRSYEEIFLQRALDHISREAELLRIIHTIQAQVLLSVYLFRNHRFMEADVYINGAVSLCLSSGLHKIRSCRPPSPVVVGVLTEREEPLSPPLDALEEGERIGAFWTVFSVHRLIGVALGTASPSFGFLDDPDTQADTPWPLDIAEYGLSTHHIDSAGFQTIENFLRADGVHTHSSTASYSKAVVLLHKAFCLCRRFRTGLVPNELDGYIAECRALENLVRYFQAVLPPVDDHNNHHRSGSPSSFTMPLYRYKSAINHVLTACTYLKIQTLLFNCGILDARQQALSVALLIIQIIRDNLNPGMIPLNPIVGTICLIACQTLSDELVRMQASGVQTGLPRVGFHGSLNSSAQQVGDVMGSEAIIHVESALEEGINVMSLIALNCPLAEYQLNKFRDVHKSSRADYHFFGP
ncbi:hypothetical protein L218DRAFT_915551 [Marasmius fiardii PR-910]|nr:hypothetical protein L218DRAFT_915551 [Marasmius fiardii PR-910]